MLKHVDLIISASYIAPVVPASLLHDYSVVIHNQTIVDLLPTTQVAGQYQAAQHTHLPQQIIIPGLINLHTHAAMSLMRGLADDVALMPWLQTHIWPAESAVMSPDFVHDGTLLACAEMLKGGITCFNDMYFYPEAAANAVNQAGMRATLGLVLLEFATRYASHAEEYLEKGLFARDILRSQTNISTMFAPHAPYTVSDSTFTKMLTLAAQLDIGIHTHLHETQAEIAQSLQQCQLRPLARLANLDLLGPNVTFAHGVYLTDLEWQILQSNGCHIAHCPSSNLKLGSGIAPIANLLASGVNVGLGTDGAASNNRLDMLSEMRLAALLAKGNSGDATAISTQKALEMATINGARALNLSDKIGSIEIGKLADLTAVDLSQCETAPLYDAISHLVYAAGREHVSHVWVNGDLKYQKMAESVGVFSGIEPQELKQIIAKWQPILAQFKK